MKGRAGGKKNLVPRIGSKTHNYEYQFVVVKYSQGTSEGCVYDFGFGILSENIEQFAARCRFSVSEVKNCSTKLIPEISKEM